MELIFSLIIGLLIGLILKIKKPLLEMNGKFQLLVLFLLLFSMGVSLGINPDIVTNLSNIGFVSIIFSVLIVGFSIIFVFICGKILRFGR
jgi:uncharacterized membrane protein YbjE (DUF340 family)